MTFTHAAVTAYVALTVALAILVVVLGILWGSAARMARSWRSAAESWQRCAETYKRQIAEAEKRRCGAIETFYTENPPLFGGKMRDLTRHVIGRSCDEN
jgi:hypothetical protein